MFISEAYILQNNTTIDIKIITAGELAVKAKYLCSMQEITSWFWDQHPQQQFITVPTRTILHTRLDVILITDIHDIPKLLYNRTQAKIHIKTSYVSDWFWLLLNFKINWLPRQNWVRNRCRSVVRGVHKGNKKLSLVEIWTTLMCAVLY